MLNTGSYRISSTSWTCIMQYQIYLLLFHLLILEYYHPNPTQRRPLLLSASYQCTRYRAGYETFCSPSAIDTDIKREKNICCNFHFIFLLWFCEHSGTRLGAIEASRFPSLSKCAPHCWTPSVAPGPKTDLWGTPLQASSQLEKWMLFDNPDWLHLCHSPHLTA